MRTNDSLQRRIHRRRERGGAGRAFGFVSGDGRIVWRTYADVHDGAARSAAALAELGVAPGDVCVLVLRSDERCARLLLAVLLAGAVPVLVAPPVVKGLHSNLVEVVAFVARKTKARVVITEQPVGAEGAPLPSRCRVVAPGAVAEPAGEGRLAPTLPEAEDVAAMQLTSGTTGFPRICVWSQRRVLAALDAMEAAMALRGEDVCVNWTPLYHDMGLVNNFLLCLVTGVPLVMMDALDFVKSPGRWLETLWRSGGTVTWSPNFGFAITAQRARLDRLEGVRLDGVRAFWNAAERIHFDTMEAFRRRFAPLGLRPHALKTNFGCAENIGGATFSDPEGDFVVEHVDAEALYRSGVARRRAPGEPGTVAIVGCGRPSPGMRIAILSRDGRPLPDGRVGQIALATPSRMNGYLGDAKATARAIRDGLVLTGDYGYLRDGELFWTGRVRERINLHGKKLDPSDLEPVLLEVDGLRKGCFAAFGVEAVEAGTERLVILSEVRRSPGRPYEAIAAEVREKVAARVGVRVDELVLLAEGTMSKTSSGKRRHRFYKSLYADDRLDAVARFGGAHA